MGRKGKKRNSKDTDINESKKEDVVYKDLVQLKQEKEKKKATFTREKNLLLQLFDEEIPSRRKLREAISKLSKAHEIVISGIVDICEEYRRKNQEKEIRKSMEDIEVIERTFNEVQERVENYLEERKYEESSLVSNQSRQRCYIQEKRLQAQQKEAKLKEEINYFEKEYEAITTKLQKEIESRRAALLTTRQTLGNERPAGEDQLHKDFDVRSVNSVERTKRVANSIEAVDLQAFLEREEEIPEDHHQRQLELPREKSIEQKKPEQKNKENPRNEPDSRRRQLENDL